MVCYSTLGHCCFDVASFGKALYIQMLPFTQVSISNISSPRYFLNGQWRYRTPFIDQGRYFQSYWSRYIGIRLVDVSISSNHMPTIYVDRIESNVAQSMSLHIGRVYTACTSILMLFRSLRSGARTFIFKWCTTIWVNLIHLPIELESLIKVTLCSFIYLSFSGPLQNGRYDLFMSKGTTLSTL